MIISKRKFEKELEKERNAILREVDYDRRFADLQNSIYRLENMIFDLRCEINKGDKENTYADSKIV